MLGTRVQLCWVHVCNNELKLLLVVQRRGHTTKNGTPGVAMMGDTNCVSEGRSMTARS